jgi:hypothetical protein
VVMGVLSAVLSQRWPISDTSAGLISHLAGQAHLSAMYILVWPQRVLTWFWLYLGGGVGYCPSRPNHFCLMCIAHSVHRFARPMFWLSSRTLIVVNRRMVRHPSPSKKCMASVFLDKRTLDHIKQILVKEDPAITCQKTLRPKRLERPGPPKRGRSKQNQFGLGYHEANPTAASNHTGGG